MVGRLNPDAVGLPIELQVERASYGTELTRGEKQELATLEEIVDEGLDSFWRVGMALCQIREKALYRAQSQTFAGYCELRFGMSVRHAQRLMVASEVVDDVRPVGRIPDNESQARPLAKLSREQRRVVWERILEESDRPTSGLIQQAVEEVLTDGGREEKASRLDNPNAHDEHYTPPEIVERVINVLGEIGLDPCSNSRETPVIPALQHWVREDDGLAKDWKAATLYMNPPYSKGNLMPWVRKLVGCLESGDVGSAIVLVPAYTSEGFWDKLLTLNPMICFHRGRVKFQGNASHARFPSAILYFGQEWGWFYNEFAGLGRILQECDRESFGA